MRNYKRENEKKNERVERFNGFIEKEKGLKFKNALASQNIKFSNWLEEQIIEYLKENEQTSTN